MGKKLEQQKEDSSNRTTQLEACLTTTFDEFEHYIHQVIPAYTEKEEIGMLKSKIEKLKEENSKLKHDMCEKEILIKHLTETLNEKKAKQMWQTETRQTRKYQSRQNIPLETRNKFPPLQNTQDEVLDKEVKKYKEKEILQRRHQTPVYSKQNHRPNPAINHFPENDNHFWLQRTVPENSKYSDAVRNGRKTLIAGTSMVKGIRMKEVNSQLRNSFAKLRPFPGTILKHLKY